MKEQIRSQGFSLFQQERGKIEFQDGLRDVTISFTKKANASTSIHEFSHFGVQMHRQFADMARQRIEQGDTNPEFQRIIDDWENLKKAVGADGDRFTVEQEEMIAKQFEGYMMEGKAPSNELRRVFSRFREWLTSIYRDLRGLNVEINPEITAVFDRWLASEDEINDVREILDAYISMMDNKELAKFIKDSKL